MSELDQVESALNPLKSIVLGAGCFWGVELSFSKLEGVVEAPVGYAGGGLANPTYERICLGDTEHAEVVKVVYDPVKISLETLLNHFFTMHDPTTLNRQGPDVGTQYRSVIFYENNTEKQVAQKIMQNQSLRFSRPIVTTLEPATVFWRAESYHQAYFKKRGVDSGCH